MGCQKNAWEWCHLQPTFYVHSVKLKAHFVVTNWAVESIEIDPIEESQPKGCPLVLADISSHRARGQFGTCRKGICHSVWIEAALCAIAEVRFCLGNILLRTAYTISEGWASLVP